MSLTREDFELGIEAMVKTKKIPIPELKGDAYVRMLDAYVRDAYDRSLFDKDGNRTQDNLGARLVCLALSDEAGVLLYEDDKPEAVAALMAKWPTPIIERLFQGARDFNLMGKGDLEEAAKNSEKTPDGSSNTD